MKEINIAINAKQNEKIINLLKSVNAHIEEQGLLKKEILDFKEACKYLRVSDSLLYKLTSNKEIPFSKPNGKKIYFKRLDLDSWMMNSKNVSLFSEEKASEWVNKNLNLKN